MATGNQAVAEAILRRWTTSQGQLIDDPNYGQNIYDLVNAGLSPRNLAYAQQQFAQEAQKDQRVLRCTVVITINVAGDVTLSANVVTANGPFNLVLSVNAVTLQLLLVQS
jgi:phage baseplate assembly protein W